MSQAIRQDFDVRDILDKGLLTTGRLQTLTAIIYGIILDADGSREAGTEMKKKIQEAIPLFEYAVRDIQSLKGTLHGVYDCIIKQAARTTARDAAKRLEIKEGAAA